MSRDFRIRSAILISDESRGNPSSAEGQSGQKEAEFSLFFADSLTLSSALHRCRLFLHFGCDYENGQKVRQITCSLGMESSPNQGLVGLVAERFLKGSRTLLNSTRVESGRSSGYVSVHLVSG